MRRYDYLCTMETSLIKLHVPEYILAHFEFERVEEISGVIRIHLIEKKDQIGRASCRERV